MFNRKFNFVLSIGACFMLFLSGCGEYSTSEPTLEQSAGKGDDELEEMICKEKGCTEDQKCKVTIELSKVTWSAKITAKCVEKDYCETKADCKIEDLGVPPIYCLNAFWDCNTKANKCVPTCGSTVICGENICKPDEICYVTEDPTGIKSECKAKQACTLASDCKGLELPPTDNDPYWTCEEGFCAVKSGRKQRCEAITSEYEEKITEAKACNPYIYLLQCYGDTFPNKLGWCSCDTHINNNYQDKDKLNHLIEEWNFLNCPSTFGLQPECDACPSLKRGICSIDSKACEDVR